MAESLVGMAMVKARRGGHRRCRRRRRWPGRVRGLAEGGARMGADGRGHGEGSHGRGPRRSLWPVVLELARRQMVAAGES
ncbi:hypothetical protein OsI_08407 [Oryza sativa Indica Group]|uniref:Uncharacterized protein n=1 Tax=Oryza sativa subsp. indica TaxID=39946 RepID=B8AGD9_ORYSI|nr:hypothetical protein OsI_08407 [Oryza sativa Indica Group]